MSTGRLEGQAGEDSSEERLSQIADASDVHQRNEEVRYRIARLMGVPLKKLAPFSADELLAMKPADLEEKIKMKRSKNAS